MSAMENAGSEPTYDQAQPARYFGKYPGVVVENGKQQGASKHIGQIKVRVPGILEETPDGQGNQPLEIVASPSFLPGFFFVPDKDDPVWVEFVAGDINSPIWTSVWYPKDKGAPQTFDGKDPTETQKIIHTSKDHVIQLDDTDGSEQIVVHDKKNGNTITLDQNGIKIEGKKGSVVIGQSDLTLKFSQTTATLKDQALELTDGVNSIKIGSSGIAITASAGVTVNGSPVVLSPLLTWLSAHQHVGNMGGPTPLLPAPPLLTSSPFVSK
jgi:hypothetical protein